MKSPVRSRTLWVTIPGSALFLIDAAQRFINSGGLENLCAQRSALAGGLLAMAAVLRFYTSEPILKPKEGPEDDRSNPKAPD